MHSRSRSPKPSLAAAFNDASVASSGLGPSSRVSSSERDVDAARRVACLSDPGNSLRQSSTTGRRAPVDFGGQPSQASRPVPPTGAVLSSAVPMLTPHHSIAQLDTQLAPPSNPTDSVQAPQHLAPPSSPYVLATTSQQSFDSNPLMARADQNPPQRRRQNPGMFNHGRKFSATGTFVDGNVGSVTYISTTSDHFMEKLLEKTIPGAASDSSARYPPPRCHPGTRLAVLERCLYFIANCVGATKIRWVFGAAGVGKSAIMQSVADSPNLPVTCHVSVFFSINGRNEGTKAIITLCYQLAAKSAPYRELIEREIARDPSLLQSSLPVQFENFFIQPFIHSDQLKAVGRVLILIDGLDECNNRETQVELLRLISDFCITYPSSPLVWLIASRPERHITSFFARANVMPAYEQEEIEVDSDDGRADVEQFLREKLEAIKEGSDSFEPHSDWPEEKEFWKLANAAGGLFAYADTVIRYIGDLNIGNPVLQLSEVLKVIDNLPMTGIPREKHPMALLDALYARILSNVPAKVILHARKLVLALASDWNKALSGRGSFVVLCNWLAMTPDEAYAAVNHLQSLLRTPRRDQAHWEMLEPFHKSFFDYVSDSSRSDFLPDMRYQAQQLKTECVFRVLNEAPDGIDFGDVDYELLYGPLRRGPGTGDKISLTWPVDGCDENTRLNVYKLAIGEVVKGLRNSDPTFTSEFCIRLLITQFNLYAPTIETLLPERVFDESRRHEFMRCGILKQIPLKAIPCIPAQYRGIMLWFRRPAQAVASSPVSSILNAVKLPFHRLARAVTSLSDPWNSSCEHGREGEWKKGKDQDWKTNFSRGGSYPCSFCNKRFERQFESLKTHSPDHIVLVMFTSTGKCRVELRFVDPDDGISEWTYWYWIELTPEERKKYGSTV